MMFIGMIPGRIDKVNIKNVEKITAAAGAQIIVTITMFIRRELVIRKNVEKVLVIATLIKTPSLLRIVDQARAAKMGSVLVLPNVRKGRAARMGSLSYPPQFVMLKLKLNTDVLGVQLVAPMLEIGQRTGLDIVQETALNVLVN